MNPVILPAIHGWLWVLQGFALFRAYAALWLLLLFFYWTAAALVSVVPVVGPLLALCTVPGIGAGFMVACRAARQRKPPTLRHIVEPFQQDRRGQLRLGLAYMAAFVAALILSAVFDHGLFLRAWLIGYSGDPREAAALYPGFAGFMALLAPILGAFWFAPGLVHWRSMAPAKALFFSIFAGLRNWRAFLVYGLGWLFFMMAVPMIVLVFLGLVLPLDMRGLTVASFVVVPYYFAVLGAMFCSIYSSYIAVFPDPAPTPDTIPPESA